MFLSQVSSVRSQEASCEGGENKLEKSETLLLRCLNDVSAKRNNQFVFESIDLSSIVIYVSSKVHGCVLHAQNLLKNSKPVSKFSVYF